MNDFVCNFFVHRLDRMSKQTTMVHQVFGGYYRSQGMHTTDVLSLELFVCLVDRVLFGVSM